MAQPHPVLVGLGNAIKARRTELRISQEELGLRSGVHRNYIGGVERAERNPSVMKIAELATELEVEVWELLRPTGAPQDPRP